MSWSCPDAMCVPLYSFTHDCCEEMRVLKAQLKRVPALDTRLPYMHLRESLQEEKLAPPHHIQTR